MNYKIDKTNKWDYENGFYLTCETGRIGKLINQLEIYKKIIDKPGDVLEFGVYKGSSFVRLLSFRDLLENNNSRKVIGFDAFGKFPNTVANENDRAFINEFESNGGLGISVSDLKECLDSKNIYNYELVKGDINTTIDEYLLRNPNLKIALLHIDVDVYEPTKKILESLWDRVIKGGILMLDDYGIVEGETRAVDEFFKNSDIEIKKEPYYSVPSYIIKS